jgi:hypothetical protein
MNINEISKAQPSTALHKLGRLTGFTFNFEKTFSLCKDSRPSFFYVFQSA